jgi:hypothetical protein
MKGNLCPLPKSIFHVVIEGGAASLSLGAGLVKVSMTLVNNERPENIIGDEILAGRRLRYLISSGSPCYLRFNFLEKTTRSVSN